MPTLLLRFRVDLRDHSSDTRHFGPLFHRWLPDGAQDAIILNTGDADAVMKVWFERFGFVNDTGWIEFSYKHKDVDANVIPTQARLDAGSLFGLLEIRDLSEEDAASLRNEEEQSATYETLAKHIVRDLFYPPLARFIDLIRTNFGQYWLSKVRRWDSRDGNLAFYCKRFGMEWSLDDGGTWSQFRPGNPIGFENITVVMGPSQAHLEYLTHEDWLDIQKASSEGYAPSSAAHNLRHAHELADEGLLRDAFIEGVIALELAISEFVRSKLTGANPLVSLALGSIKSKSAKMNLNVQITLIGASVGISPLDIQSAVDSIDMRNRIIHDGINPPDTANSQLRGLLRAIAALLPGPKFKFPSAHGTNVRMPIAEWEQFMSASDG